MHVTKNKIAAILRESIFTPTKNKPMKIIMDVGNFGYFVRRATEILETTKDTYKPEPIYNALTQAISLLALAKLSINETVQLCLENQESQKVTDG